jgi:hypothetical protein
VTAATTAHAACSASTPLVADKMLGYLLYGNKQLCNLKEIHVRVGFHIDKQK